MLAQAVDTSIYPMQPREFNAFRAMVHEQTGIWLRDGKQIMLAARLSKRLRLHGINDFSEYYKYVQKLPKDSEEIRELINCVTTNKTSFFREKHHFDFLAGTVVPGIQAAALRGGPRSVRIWCAASSTGEEPYTIAMTLIEALQSVGTSSSQCTTALNKFSSMPRIPASWKIEVIASDIDTKVLDTAKRAIYGTDSLLSVETRLQKKYFLRGKDGMHGQVKVKPDVARLVQFTRINLMDSNWPVEGVFDAIFFRNALIYFNQNTQELFLRKMVRFLKPRGYLFLGNSEHIPWMHDTLEPLMQTMYRLRPEAR